MAAGVDLDHSCLIGGFGRGVPGDHGLHEEWLVWHVQREWGDGIDGEVGDEGEVLDSCGDLARDAWSVRRFSDIVPVAVGEV
jgi:hypothetical protein